jgi:hypothetical protein
MKALRKCRDSANALPQEKKVLPFEEGWTRCRTNKKEPARPEPSGMLKKTE